jgi:hypothetical protein
MESGSSVTISQVLIPRLREKFSHRRPRLASPPEPVAVFPAACSEVGHLSIYDDGDEATVLIEHVTHHHVNPNDGSLSSEERARFVTESVVEFLEELFADRVLLWAIERGERGGGWLRPFEGDISGEVPHDADVFVWSKRIR